MIAKVPQRPNMILQCTVSCLESLRCAAVSIQIQLLSHLGVRETKMEITDTSRNVLPNQKGWSLPKPVIHKERQRGRNSLIYH